MNKKSWQKIALATGGFLGSLAVFKANPVQAAVITYDFKVVNITGALEGRTFTGLFSFDDTNFKRKGLESVCDIINTGSCSPDAFTNLISFEFNFLGRKFTQFDDDFRRTAVFFKDGKPTEIYYRQDFDYETAPESGGDSFIIRLTSTGFVKYPFQYAFWDYQVFGRDDGYGTGDVIITERKDPIKSTPEPSAMMALSLLGLGGLMVGKKKR